VGESHYQDFLEHMAGGRTEDEANKVWPCTIVPEDDNPYDNMAVRIDIGGSTVGYLDRETARSYRTQLSKAGLDGRTTGCYAKIVGGWYREEEDEEGEIEEDRGYFGVKLDLPID